MDKLTQVRDTVADCVENEVTIKDRDGSYPKEIPSHIKLITEHTYDPKVTFL